MIQGRNGENLQTNILRITITCVVGMAGGALFYLFQWPLPWILGAAAGIMLINGWRPEVVEWPRPYSQLGIVVIAYMMGRTIQPDTAIMMGHELPWMIASGLFWFGVCFLIGLLLSRLIPLDQASSVIGTMPGGLSQMVLLADEFKSAHPGVVAVIQTSRLVIVLYTVPFLAVLIAGSGEWVVTSNPQTVVNAVTMANDSWASMWGLLLLPLVPLAAWLANRVHFPAGEFTIPFLLVGTLTVLGCPWPAVPSFLVPVAQLLIGIHIGSRVYPRIFLTHKRLAPIAMGTGAFLVAISVVAAWLLAQWTEDSIVTWFLALAPGGLAEMATTALFLHGDVAQVTAYQLFRVLFIVLAVPPILRWMLKA